MTTLASTSLAQLRYIEETAYGEIPVAGNPKELRMTGESLDYSIEKISSEELNADRANTDMIAVNASTSGNIEAELSFAEYDDFFRAGLMGAWAPYGVAGIGSVFEATITSTTITASVAPTGSSAFTNLLPGQWFKLGGTSTANDTRLFRVSKTTAPTSTVITLDPNTPAVAGGPYAATVLKAARLSNGKQLRTFVLEKNYSDVSEFFAYRGQAVSSFSLNMSSGAITTLSFSMMGRDAVADNTTMLPGTPIASTTNRVMSGVSGESCALWADGAPITGTFINSIALSYDNALRAQNALCSLGSVGIGLGTINATLDVEMYFTSGRTFFDDFLGNTNQELAFTTVDTEGNGYIFTVPKANVSSYQVTAGGRDSDLMVSIQFTGLLDKANAVAGNRKVLMIDRVGTALA